MRSKLFLIIVCIINLLINVGNKLQIEKVIKTQRRNMEIRELDIKIIESKMEVLIHNYGK